MFNSSHKEPETLDGETPKFRDPQEMDDGKGEMSGREDVKEENGGSHHCDAVNVHMEDEGANSENEFAGSDPNLRWINSFVKMNYVPETTRLKGLLRTPLVKEWREDEFKIKVQEFVPKLENAEIQALMKDAEFLGEGGYGSIYKVMYDRQPAALKVVYGFLGHSLYREMTRHVALNGKGGAPKLLAFSDFPMCMLMEYCHGRRLLDIIEDPSVPKDEILRLFRGCAEALYELNQAGIVHMDFKLDNVIIEKNNATDDGFKVRLIDFGISRAEGDYVRMNVPDDCIYAPEIRGGVVASATLDVFAFGFVVGQVIERLPGPKLSMLWKVSCLAQSEVVTERPSFPEIIQVINAVISDHVSD
ncbi:probable serine/threonine-protein kinase drkD [Palaemon carinicauda]|uniref:probable serine/threonine-protein kinase drkD n=1 Tax=Palaemon carinicauda TaxID=392227 RepID=UPI0035B69327